MSTNSNVFKTTSLAVGDSATIVITDVKEGKFGPMYLGTVNGQSALINPSGNLKNVFQKAELNKALTITRIPDVKTQAGFNVTQFTLGDAAPAAATNVTSVADKLAAIRAKRTTS